MKRYQKNQKNNLANSIVLGNGLGEFPVPQQPQAFESSLEEKYEKN